MTCIDDRRLLEYLLGELSVNETTAIDGHVAECAACRRRVDAQREVFGDLAGFPEAGLDDDVFVTRVMAACDAAAPLSTGTRRVGIGRGWVLVGVGALLGAAAVVGMMVHTPHAPGSGDYSARGLGSENRSRTAIEAFAVRGRTPELLEGAELTDGDGILIRYSNSSPGDAYLMVFLMDEKREVHWIHPAYLQKDSDPASMPLLREVKSRVLDEVVEPDSPAPGRATLYALVTTAPLHVKAVEARLARNSLPVADLFGGAEVQEWRCTWRAR